MDEHHRYLTRADADRARLVQLVAHQERTVAALRQLADEQERYIGVLHRVVDTQAQTIVLQRRRVETLAGVVRRLLGRQRSGGRREG